MLSPTIGRVLSAGGAVVVAVALVLTWYHIDRSALQGTTESTGWQTFTNLRWAILAGAAFVLVTAHLRQTRPVLVATVLWGPPAGELTAGAPPADRAARWERTGPGGGGRQAEVVDSTAEEVRS